MIREKHELMVEGDSKEKGVCMTSQLRQYGPWPIMKTLTDGQSQPMLKKAEGVKMQPGL